MHAMHADLDLDLLRTLDALVRLGNVTAAGRELGRTQSATSHALARLRAALGDEVLVRTASGMVPTALAEQLAERARRILDDVARLAGARAFDPETARRTFTIAMSDGGQLLALPPLLRDLAENAPGISIRVRRPAPDNAKLLESGGLALVLGGSSVGQGDAPALHRQQLLDDPLVWVIRRHDGAPRTLSLEDLVRRGRVQVERPGAGRTIDRAVEQAGLPPVPTIDVPGLLTALMIVVRSDRVLTMTREVAHAVEHAMPIEAIPPAIDLGSAVIFQHWHARLDSDPAHAWLRQRIKRVAERRAWRTAP